jgi:hypothetical protein
VRHPRLELGHFPVLEHKSCSPGTGRNRPAAVINGDVINEDARRRAGS